MVRGYISSPGEHVKLYYTSVAPGQPVASVALIHGLGEGHQSYMGLAGMLAARGFAVHTVDFRGFGGSGGLRGEHCFRHYLRDIETLIGCCKRSIPLFLYGHGVGACLALALLALNPGLPIAGVITTSLVTGIEGRRSSGLLRWALYHTGLLDSLLVSSCTNPSALSKDLTRAMISDLPHLFTVKLVRELDAYR